MLTPERYGAFQGAWVAITVIASVFIGGLPLAGLTFAARTAAAGWRTLWRRLVLLHTIGVVGAAVTLWMALPVLRAWDRGLSAVDALALLPHLALVVGVSFYEPYLIVSSRAQRFASVAWVSWFVAACAAPVVVALGGSVPFALSVFAVGAAIRLLFGLRDLIRLPPPDGGHDPPPGYRRILMFSVPITATVLIGTFSRWVDKALVASWFPPEQFAVYINGAVELPFLMVLLGAVTSSLLPEYSRLHHIDDRKSFAELWGKSATILAAILFPVATLGVAISAPVVVAVFGGHYWASRWGLRIFLFLVPLRIAAYEPVLLAAGKVRVVTWMSIADFIAIIVLGRLLIPVFGIWGAAVGAVAATYLQVVVYLLFIKRELEVPFLRLLPWGQLALNASAALVAGAFAYVAAKLVGGYWPGMFAAIVVFLSVYVILARAGLVSPAVRSHLWRAVRFDR
jgi:O-antigen/teichoic acid export membrane protein